MSSNYGRDPFQGRLIERKIAIIHKQEVSSSINPALEKAIFSVLIKGIIRCKADCKEDG